MWFQGSKRREAEQAELLKKSLHEVQGMREMIKGIIQRQESDADTMSRLAVSIDGSFGHLEGLEQRQKEYEKQMRRQAESFEDLLEELQERQEAQRRAEGLLKEAGQREEALLGLICCMQEQMGLLERVLTNDHSLGEEKQNAWREQFRGMRQELAKHMRRCGMEETGNVGEIADYDIHEVLAAAEPEQEAEAGKVAQVHSRGCLYRGRLLKKAQVTVFKEKSE